MATTRRAKRLALHVVDSTTRTPPPKIYLYLVGTCTWVEAAAPKSALPVCGGCCPPLIFKEVDYKISIIDFR